RAKVTFAAVLMYVHRPERDGLKAAAAIRDGERSSGAHVPIVAMTAHAMTGDRERCLAAGMDSYVSKPLRPDELLAAIDEVVAGAVSTPAVVDRAEPPPVAVDVPHLAAAFGGSRNR